MVLLKMWKSFLGPSYVRNKCSQDMSGNLNKNEYKINGYKCIHCVQCVSCICTQKMETTNMGLNLLIVKCFGIVTSAKGSYQMFLECI